MTPHSIIFLSLLLPNCLALTTTRSGLLQCEFYDKQCIDEAHKKGETEIPSNCSKIDTCSGPDEVCYTAWHSEGKNLTELVKEGRHHVFKMGCFPISGKNCGTDRCLHREANPRGPHTLFCCCESNLCNAKFEWVPDKPETTEAPVTEAPDQQDKSHVSVIVLILIAIGIILFSVLIVSLHFI